MSVLRLMLAEIGYRKVNFGLSLFAVLIAATLFVAGPMLVDGYQAETRSEISQWKEQVEESERLVDEVKQGMSRAESETAATMAELEEGTRRIMLELGFNLLIVHEKTNMSDFWAADYSAADMPQEYVDRLAADRRLTLVTHLVATLQERMNWENRKVLLVGYLPETGQKHMPHKSSMGYDIRPGTALLGHELRGGRKPGDTIRVEGRDGKSREFQVERILPEQGSKEDISIAIHLSDAQELLGKPGKINQIMALGCRCPGPSLPKIRQQLAEVLPQTRITEFRTNALARAEQRKLVEAERQQLLGQLKSNLDERQRILDERRQILDGMEASREKIRRTVETLAGVVTPLVVLAAAIWVGLLALGNARQRRVEIGLLRALGKGSSTIASLFLGKAVLLGLVGAVFGVLLGTGLARWLGVQSLEIPSERMALRPDLTVYALIGAPLLSALASYLPTLAALAEDPALALREP